MLSAELDRQVVRHGPPHQEGRGAAQDRRQTGTLLQTLAVPARHLSHPQVDEGGRRHSFITLTLFVVCVLLLFGGRGVVARGMFRHTKTLIQMLAVPARHPSHPGWTKLERSASFTKVNMVLKVHRNGNSLSVFALLCSNK